MEQILIRHFETREFIYPISRNSVRVKLECLAKNDCSVNILYWKRFKEHDVKKRTLNNFNQNGSSNYYSTKLTFDESVRYLNYYFEIIIGRESLYYSPYGLSKEYPVKFFEYQSTNENDVFEIPSWAKGIVGYHIFLDRFFNGNKDNDLKNIENWNSPPNRVNFFGGDIRGIIEKFDYLKDLDVKLICLTPIFMSPSNHKYDISNYFEIDPSFGTIDDLKDLVNLCHKNEIKIILDGVFNHIGYYSFQFQDAINLGPNSKYWGWFYIEGNKIDTENINYECVGDYKWMPKLRYSNEKLRKYIRTVGEYWIKETSIDGWRLDVADEVDFTFWQEFRKSIKRLDKDILLVGETWRDGRDLINGDQMDTIMNYKFRDSVVDYFAKNIIDKEKFKERIENLLFHYPFQVHHILYNLLGSHDTARFLTVCSQELDSFKMGIAFQMTFPGMPVVYYGDEIGLEGESDPVCRATMKWESMNEDILIFYKKMIQIRNNNKALKYGDFKHFDVDERIYGFIREFEEETVVVLFNNGINGFNTNFYVPSCAKSTSVESEEHKIQINIAARAFRIVRVTREEGKLRIEIVI